RSVKQGVQWFWLLPEGKDEQDFVTDKDTKSCEDLPFYMNGQSVSQIASELGIPEGTVKSRLHLGRDHVKKGISDMEKYSKQSYSPIKLHVSYSGNPGLNGEPITLIKNDLIAQNILWLAYPEYDD
ncbi:MAG: sigma factor-like helix-turn-helix DNA-binding protein, partial [Huintestinicola sp.]